jgi:hypothetical protein
MAYTTISKPSLYFNTLLRTGNYAGSGTTAITGVGFAPGLMWEKKRNGTSIHALLDQVRGNSKQLRSESTAAETTTSQYASIDSDGFTVNNSGDYGGSDNLVSWHWKANGAGSSNSDGSITSTVSANTTSGFSIVTYTGNGVSGATVGHGLSTTAPKVVLIKKTSGADSWSMLNTNIDLNKYLKLEGTDAQVSDPLFNNTAPTTSVFTVDSDGQVNGNTNTFVAYCFSEVKGYSKIGSYTGNGNADGPFIYTGFKPAFVFQKRTDSTSNWHIFDNKREPENVMDKYLAPNDSGAEGTATGFDFLSNGFKSRTSSNWNNQSGGTYIYMAFAEEPLVANVGASIPATAR